jgi:large subunit ribosomal protein L6
MSRIANSPIALPSSVEVKLQGQRISVKGSKGSLEMDIPEGIKLEQDDGELKVVTQGNSKQARALSGTTRALVSNMVVGVTAGFERRLQLQGVGYRAQAQGKKLNLQLGFSHPIEYELPDGVTAETPSQTEIVVSGVDNQLVGQVSAEIRSFRPPEPYKGKGVRYLNERVRRKEAKKK